MKKVWKSGIIGFLFDIVMGLINAAIEIARTILELFQGNPRWLVVSS